MQTLAQLLPPAEMGTAHQFNTMGYYLTFDDNILGLGGPDELAMEVKTYFSSIDDLNESLESWDDWELCAHNVRISPVEWAYDPTVPF